MRLADRFRAAMLLVAALALAAPSGAAEPRDRLFQAGTLASLPAEAVLTFSRDRTVPDGSDVEVITDGGLTIRIAAGASGGGTSAAVSFDEPDREVRLPAAPTSGGHPALLVFLESTVSSLSAISGGSPYYLKNRFIESFAQPVSVEPATVAFAGTEVPGERMLFRPFEGDDNADRLGALAELELVFVLSPSVPGGLASASAEGGGFRHAIVLETAEGTQ